MRKLIFISFFLLSFFPISALASQEFIYPTNATETIISVSGAGSKSGSLITFPVTSTIVALAIDLGGCTNAVGSSTGCPVQIQYDLTCLNATTSQERTLISFMVSCNSASSTGLYMQSCSPTSFWRPMYTTCGMNESLKYYRVALYAPNQATTTIMYENFSTWYVDRDLKTTMAIFDQYIILFLEFVLFCFVAWIVMRIYKR